jgi:hypothetical protein
MYEYTETNIDFFITLVLHTKVNETEDSQVTDNHMEHHAYEMRLKQDRMYSSCHNE